MKKIFLFSWLLLSIPYFSFSQNVGIGTTTPAFKLDVKSGSINTDSLYRINNFPVISVKGRGNFFAGKNAGSLNTGSGNTGTGDSSLYSNTTGFSNTAIGNKSLFLNTTGTNNTAIGHLSLSANTSGNSNVATGREALTSNTTGTANTANGTTALRLNTTGTANTGFGSSALNNNVTGSYNTALGFSANVAVANLNNATAIGSYSLVDCNNCLTLGGTGLYSTKVGIDNPFPLADLHIIQQSDAPGDISRGIRMQRSTGSNQWRIYVDGSNLLTFEYNNGGAGSWGWINTSGSFVNGSDMRSKKNIQLLENNILDKVMKLQPKKYLFNKQNSSEEYSYGFLAQDVQKIFPEFVSERDGGYLGIAYSNLGVVAVKAIQEQQQEIDELKKQNYELQEQYTYLKKEIEILTRRAPLKKIKNH